MPRRVSTTLTVTCAFLPAMVMAGPLPGLIAAGPAGGGYPGMDLFAPLLGHWDYRYRFYTEPGKVREEGTGTWDFSWILGGRAIQDVQTFRTADGKLQESGTTLRIPRSDGSWWAIWDGPLRGNVCELTARRGAEGIVMDGTCNGDPAPERWMFRQITASGFEWSGYVSPDRGKSWVLEETISAQRGGKI